MGTANRQAEADFLQSIVRVPSPPELTSVGPREAVVHEAGRVRRHQDLVPDTDHQIDGFAFRTLPEPGELLSTFATVNDVHFGEVECGVIHDSDIGPTFRSAPGAPPYPEVMNRAAVQELLALDLDHLVVKGDLTSNGTEEELDAFRAVYEGAFAGRLTVVRGNHESYHHQRAYSTPVQATALDGVLLLTLDTSVDGATPGTVTADQLAEVEQLAAEADRPVLLFGHHPLGDPDSSERADQTFGIDLEASARLAALVARQPRVRGYFSGHTHRNRKRVFPATGTAVWGEVACVKDYPGAWAEYRVHEGGILQIFHRISTPEALAWTEQTRHMYEGLYQDYAFGSLADRCFVLPVS